MNNVLIIIYPILLYLGLNGIRKTTSVNSPWFQTVLYDALATQLYNTNITKEQLPDGSNSFFRQLDYIIATIGKDNTYINMLCICKKTLIVVKLLVVK